MGSARPPAAPPIFPRVQQAEPRTLWATAKSQLAPRLDHYNGIVLTNDEIKGLSAGLLVSKSDATPPASTRLSEWLVDNGAELGRGYASEIARHYQ